MTVPFARAWGGLLFVFAATVAGGCSGDKPSGSVSGVVKYKGSPLAAGEVNFISKTGAAASAKIDANGQFKVANPMPVGEYRAYVAPPIPEPQAPGTKVTAAPKFELPAKFRDPSSSGVVVEVKSGTNDIPIEFKD
ncbi:MAG TPA: hypothetical protein VGE74_28695 [Gemmata sp.]